MTPQQPLGQPLRRPAYDDAATVREMHDDCLAVGRNLRLDRFDRLARAAAAPVPSLAFDQFPREVPKRDIRIDDAAQRLANALHLHLD
ncbi:hypothetical protein GGQ22_10495 [Nocardioides sp. zg-579]|uniref:Uncharacterized protein n=1 Tax=Nocardioides marmotae TaxID=2663857 RepID=A0A6I3JBT9_9ACTN|nr:hypothetical protein [Nocardioides marmotae]MCR6031873.1 hypothetical protein [Gordonia jinghuaiqii]MTB95513.1 hypothetical protein [Nocardioides marmotae]QKE00943.1 hypothetical protein HPC71_07555 [Nocardioides marmotae]